MPSPPSYQAMGTHYSPRQLPQTLFTFRSLSFLGLGSMPQVVPAKDPILSEAALSWG